MLHKTHCKYNEKKLNHMQIHLHEVNILQIHNARPEFVKNITAINQLESSILIQGVIICEMFRSVDF